MRKDNILISLLLFPLGQLYAQEQKTTRPNVIFIITDDQGKNDLGCEGNNYIQTPNIDSFYKRSVHFTNYHVSTTSAPSRSAIMTGRHTNRLNVYHTISGRSLLYEDEIILPQIFAQNGYITGMFGKWHLGDNYPFRPEDRGFHEVLRHGGGGIGNGPDYWDNDYFDDTYWHNGIPQPYKGYCTDVFFENALQFIETNKNHPFFCYIATNAPHYPWNVPEEYQQRYKDVNIPQNTKRFYSMISNIDDNFGRLEKRLKDLGLLENTILIFTTDNGTQGGEKVFSAGLRGRKGSEYEGGHRVPFYISWPKGNIDGGIDISKLVSHYDLLPTFVDLLNFDFTPIKQLDGTSLKPLLLGNDDNWPNRILYIDTQRRLNLIKYKNYCVMDERWRLINGKELYDIETDLHQDHNVIDEYPQEAIRLAEGYEVWWNSIMSEGVDERYAYIKVGALNENPVRISTHDMLNPASCVWHQRDAISCGQSNGMWKIEIIESGRYKISLRRFPRESGLAINSLFEGKPSTKENQRPIPASKKDDFTKAFLNLAGINETKTLDTNDEEVNFIAEIPKGKYDMTAELFDSIGRRFPAYYVYIEKL